MAVKYKYTIQLILWIVYASFLTAFLSLFTQIPGLYGTKGIMPVHNVLPNENKDFMDQIKEEPTLIWLAYTFNLDPAAGMLVISIVGASVSFIALLNSRYRNSITMFAVWILYLSLYKGGQKFLYFQWDSLLLETGFLCIFLAPLRFWNTVIDRPHDELRVWLVRWLAFRLMFSSGIVKLSAQCPTWWTLTALHYHFESQCIPTPLSWYLHHQPDWVLKLSVVMTYYGEIVAPLLFLTPSRYLRLFGLVIQIGLLGGINIGGNYNFFGMLSLAIAMATIDDGFYNFLERGISLTWVKKSKKRKNKKVLSLFSIYRKNYQKLDLFVITPLVIGITVYATIKYFNINLNLETYTIESKVGFTENEFEEFVKWIVPKTVYTGAMWLVSISLVTIYKCFYDVRGYLWKFYFLLESIIYILIAFSMFSYSLLSYTAIDMEFRDTFPQKLYELDSVLDTYQLSSHYGPFRRMTGIGGRPEVVIEGSNNHSDTESWKEFEFLYKIGNLSKAPPIVAPHQPRLDWQMWFAALSSYQHDRWIIQLMNKILEYEPTVMILLDTPPFKEPPTYIRAQSYLYHYTQDKNVDADWWSRDNEKEYVPVVTHDHQTVIDFLKDSKLYYEGKDEREYIPYVEVLVLRVYWLVMQLFYPHTLIWCALGLALLINTANYLLAKFTYGVIWIMDVIIVTSIVASIAWIVIISNLG